MVDTLEQSHHHQQQQKPKLLTYLREYFSLDLRALALFRVFLGVTLFIDTARRLPYIQLFYSNEGVWSCHYALFDPRIKPVFSLLFAFCRPIEALLFFAATMAAAICIAIGIKTRAALFFGLLGFMSIINRATFLQYGGDTVLLIFLVWSQFLPLGTYWSIDAKRRKNQSKQGALHPTRTLSIATAAVLIQFTGIYIVAALQKDGTTWREGSVIHYVLHQDRIVTYLGLFMRTHFDWRILRLMSWASLVLEYMIPVGLLIPLPHRWKWKTRTISIISVFVFHGGIALCINIGMFPYVMILASVLFLPSEIFSMSFKRKATAGYDSGLSFVATGITIVILIVGFFDYAHGNRAIKNALTVPYPHWVRTVVDYTSFRQGWNMFSPNAPTADFYSVIDIKCSDGSHIDPRTGRPPTFERVRKNILEWDQMLDAYSRLIAQPSEGLRLEFKRWLFDRGAQGFAFGVPCTPIKAMLWEVKDQSPLPFQNEIVKPSKVEKILRYELTR